MVLLSFWQVQSNTPNQYTANHPFEVTQPFIRIYLVRICYYNNIYVFILLLQPFSISYLPPILSIILNSLVSNFIYLFCPFL